MSAAARVRDEFLPFALPTIDETDIAEVVDVLRSGWLTSGPRIQKFELELADEIGAAAVHAVNSGTAAMQVALAALDVRPGTAVITTPMTFAATAHVIEHAGCRPLFVDVEPDTLNLDPDAVEREIAADRAEIGAILPVHYAGHPCELDRIVALARRRGIPVVEDSAHAFGAEFRGTPIGRIDAAENDRASCFSFYATKNISTGEGGALAAAEAVVRAARLWSLHGMSRDSWQRYGPRGSWDYEIVLPGHKCNMSDLQAALGSAQLRRWRSFQERRTEIAHRYGQGFADVDEVELPTARPHVTHAWHLYPIRLDLSRLRTGRAEFVEQLRERNIGTSVHFIPLHLQPYYRDRYGYSPDAFPRATAAFQGLVSLPIYPRMTDQDVDDVVAAVRDVVATNLRGPR